MTREAETYDEQLAHALGRVERFFGETKPADTDTGETLDLRASLKEVREISELLRRIEQSERAHRVVTEALHQTRSHLHSVIGTVPIILWQVSADGTITLSEGKALAALGLEPGQLVGQSVYAVYADFPESLTAIRRALRGEAVHAEVDVGGRIWSNQYFPQHSSDGEVSGLTGLSLDVTAERTLERERRELEEQMRHAQKLESLGVLASGIAHDFNNYLSVILGSVNLATQRLGPESVAERHLSQAENAVLRASELTRQMLAYAGRGHGAMGLLDLNLLVRELGALLSASVIKGAVVRYSLADDLPALRGDSAQLQQVIMNLITNASDALGETGTIEVSTGRCAAKPPPPQPGESVESGEGEPPQERIFFSVRDTGHGMDAATQARIFEPFYTTKVSGRGLGLAAVSGIVRSHAGEIHVSSEPGVGTEIRVELPVAEAHAAEVATGTRAALPTDEYRGTGTVLVIDDDASVREVLAETLRFAGHDAEQASSGQAGLDALRAAPGKYVAVIIDVMMPGKSGLEVLAELRKDSDLPAMLVTGVEMDGAELSAQQEVNTSCLYKPFSSDAFLATLGALRQRAVGIT